MQTTESRSMEHCDLDRYSNAQLIEALITDQQAAVAAVLASQADLVAALDAALPRVLAGGRLIYVGAGSSGRLGVLDGVELSPTFSWPQARAIGLLAGGPEAMFMAVEGAEDDASEGARQLTDLALSTQDVVLLIAASGSTPFVLGALDAARAAGALTIGLANNPGSALLQRADIAILLASGAEIIAGSTRLKAGTAQKIALNSFSSALMVRLNKVYGNLMVDVKPANAKLRRRCVQLLMQIPECDEAQALRLLELSAYQVKPAVVMHYKQLDLAAAQALLAQHQGSLRRVLELQEGNSQ